MLSLILFFAASPILTVNLLIDLAKADTWHFKLESIIIHIVDRGGLLNDDIINISRCVETLNGLAEWWSSRHLI